MKKRRTLIMSPLEWQMTAAPVSHPTRPVIAERGGTELHTPRPVVLIDTREQNPFSFARFGGWFAGIQKKPLGDLPEPECTHKFPSDEGFFARWQRSK